MSIPGTRELPIGEEVDVLNGGELSCFCIDQLEPETYLDEFIDSLNSYLPGYVFDRISLETHEARLRDGLTDKTPLDRAREFLQKTHADRTFDSGEFGEFLLYLFAKEVKGAHKLATKIQSRGSAVATLPGRDNTFAWQDENSDIYMLVGEAKVTPTSNDGLKSAQTDLNNFWASGRVGHEISLASTHIRAEMTEENMDLYETYFIDDHPNHANLKYKNIVFVGYNLRAIQEVRAGKISDEDFIKRVCENLKRSFSNQEALVSASPCASIYCFLPFESIGNARIIFSRINNLII